MQNNKKTLFISLICSAVVAVVAAFIFGFFGARLSFEWSGGYQLKVACENEESFKDAKIKALTLFNEYEISVYSTEKLTNGADEIFVVKTQQKTISNDVKQSITNRINNIDGVTVKSFDLVHSNYKTPAWVIPVTATILAIVAAIAVYFLTKRLADLIAAFSAITLSAALMLSLVVLTRIQLSSNSVVALFIATLVQALFTFIMLLNTKTKQKSVLKNDMPLPVVAAKVTKETLGQNCMLIITAIVASVVCVFINSSSIMNFGFALLIGIAVDLFVSFFVVLNLKVILEYAFEKRYNNKIVEKSSDSSPKSEKTVVNKKTVSKKHKRNTNSNENKVVV